MTVKSFGVGGELHRLWSEQAAGLVMAVAGVHASEMVDDDVWAERANHAHHVFEDLVIPNFLCLFRRFGEAKVRGASEKEFYPIAAGGGEELLRADKAQLRRLLGTKVVLSAFA